MSIADGIGLIEWEGGLFEPGSDLLARLRWAFYHIRKDGGKIKLNEAGRPFGVYSDQFVRNAEETASGRSTVYFQWGRYQRKETPSAANPANGIHASEHTEGIASDTDASDMALRAYYFDLAGLVNTIDSESWHWAIRYPARVDLTGWADLSKNPFDDGEDMPSTGQIWDEAQASLEGNAPSVVLREILNNSRVAARGNDVHGIVQDETHDVPSYGSMAIYGEGVPGGWLQLSEGLGPRDEWAAWVAIENKLGRNVDLVSVDENGWKLSMRRHDKSTEGAKQ